MQNRIVLGSCDHRAAWFFLILLQLSSYSLLIASVFTPTWATTSTTELGLYQCSTSCAKSNYKDQRIFTCAQYDFSLNFNTPSVSLQLLSACSMFSGLERAFYIYIISAGATTILTLIWCVTVFSFCARNNSYASGTIFAFLGLAAQSVGVVFWIIESQTVLDQCPSYPTDGSTPNLCSAMGIRLAIGSASLSALSFLLYVLVGRAFKRKMAQVMEVKSVKNSNKQVVPDNSTMPIIAWEKRV
jgi:hypothetical protein